MRSSVFLLLAGVAVTAIPAKSGRIVGGSLTTIDRYPDMAVLLSNKYTATFRQFCGGTIINNRSILSAAHCTINYAPAQLRTRLGSSFAHSGGRVFDTLLIIEHDQYQDVAAYNNDICIIRVRGEIFFNHVIRPGMFPNPEGGDVPDNAVVWATGWGRINPPSLETSEQLRHVQVYTINQEICRERHGHNWVTDNMLCSGVLDVGGRDQCTQDSGGPLYYNGVVVGVCSWGPPDCGNPRLPGVNTRVQRYVGWIVQNF